MEKAAAARVIALPNRGREAGTWLHHIVSNYDRLADRTVFMQGDPFDHLLPGVGIDRYLNGTEDVFLPLTAVARADYAAEDLDLWSWGALTDAEMATLSAI